ncbi:MAG: DinB family protein [Candidatus Limnocylindrales bacterium]
MTDTSGPTAALYAGYFHEAHKAMREVVSGLSPALLDWKPGTETNSIAALIAHTLDSERGLTAIVAGTALPRDRDAAFRVSGLSADDLVTLIDAAERDVDGFLAGLTEERLDAPIERPMRTASGAWWLLHAAVHSQEHIGQATLTRQLAEQAVAARQGK